MFRKFTSRKFLIAVGSLVLQTLGVDLPAEVFGVAASYILGESFVDGRRAAKSA